MFVSRVKINNYKNLKNVDINIGRLVVLVGENNSGKSNILKAITLPFLNDEVGSINKLLTWEDLNRASLDEYFQFLSDRYQDIKENSMKIEEFIEKLPGVFVEVELSPSKKEGYFVKSWSVGNSESEKTTYGLRYEFKVKNVDELYNHVKKVLPDNKTDINNLRMNLLPIHYYQYKIIVPESDASVSFSDLNEFKYNALVAERDGFSFSNTQIGSKALVTLLNSKLNDHDKIKIEKSYGEFFDVLKNISNVENIMNWQDNTGLENAKDFFEKITLMPNMPSMTSLLNNVRLGYGDELLYAQGLGFKNLVYLLVMINSMEISNESVYKMLTIEEPEAHLSISNKRLLTSFINSMVDKWSGLQLFISTHSTEFVNKLDLQNVTVVNNGKAFSLLTDMKTEERNYLAKKPNLDFLKFLFSKKCILVEGPTEEMLIRTYLHNKKEILTDIEVISLHKGFTKMIELWLKVNRNSSHQLGIIRDYDNQDTAKSKHEKYNEEANIIVRTTSSYTLEDEFVKKGGNFLILKKYFEDCHGWTEIDTDDKLSAKWKNAKTDTMLKFCQDMGISELEDLELPDHINDVLKFLITGKKT